MADASRCIDDVIRAIDEQLRLCLALRRGYLRLHPDAPRTRRERELEALAEATGMDVVRAVYGTDAQSFD